MPSWGHPSDILSAISWEMRLWAHRKIYGFHCQHQWRWLSPSKEQEIKTFRQRKRRLTETIPAGCALPNHKAWVTVNSVFHVTGKSGTPSVPATLPLLPSSEEQAEIWLFVSPVLPRLDLFIGCLEDNKWTVIMKSHAFFMTAIFSLPLFLMRGRNVAKHATSSFLDEWNQVLEGIEERSLRCCWMTAVMYLGQIKF